MKEKDCGCKRSDAWRCAKEQNSPELACSCSCHRYLEESLAVTPIQALQRVETHLDAVKQIIEDLIQLRTIMLEKYPNLYPANNEGNDTSISHLQHELAAYEDYSSCIRKVLGNEKSS